MHSGKGWTGLSQVQQSRARAMGQSKIRVETDARSRAAQKLSDGKPIMDSALLLRCAETIEGLKAALEDIAAQSQARGGIWARKRAEDALDSDG